MGLTSAQWSMDVCMIEGADRRSVTVRVTVRVTASCGIAATGAGGRPCAGDGRAVPFIPASCPRTAGFRPR